jgi:hypothetical protein
MSGRARPQSQQLLLLLLAHIVGEAGARPSPAIRNERRGYLVLNYDTSTVPPINPSLLTAQVCAIVGSYLFVVAVLLTFLFTIGRRLRRFAQTSPGTLEVEMVKPTNLLPLKSGAVAHEPSPISPPSAVSPSRSWFKGFRRSSSTASASLHSGPTSPTSPGVTSVASFDRAVLERDREKRESEMDRLYAAVAEHEAKQAKVVALSVDGDRTSQPASPTSTRRPLAPIHTTGTAKDASPISPTSPRSPFKAIYPPDSPARFAPPNSATQYPSPMSQSPPRNVLRRESQVSISSSSSKKTRKALRNLRISAPMQKYPGEAADDEARTPLSPRFYAPGPPPEPPSATSTNPYTPHTPHTPHTPLDADPATVYEQLDEPRPLPSPAPHRGFSQTNVGFSPVESPVESRRPSTLRSANNSNGTLPLRDNTSDYAPAKTTLLSPRKDRFNALRSGGGTMLRSPVTGQLVPPYSPYMPFTPVTPVTPHLITKQERKQRKKNEGKRVAVDEDLVEDPQDMWE